MKKKITLINTISSILLQCVTIISGFIIPRLLLETFGSEVNGLVSSLTQFLKYMDLFEGGLSSVILACLYRPLSEKDNEKTSSIVSAADKFYKKLSLFFVAYTVILAIIYPIVVKTEFSFGYISSLTLILSINLFCQYCFSISWRTLLRADKKVYYISFVQIVVIVLNTIGVAIGIKIFPNIHIIKIITTIIYLLQPILFNWYIKKQYKINIKSDPDKEALSQRWNGFGINIAFFIHNNTDVVVLSLLSDLKNVSVYSVYYLVTSGLKSLITSISAGIQPTLGHVYVSKDKEKLNNIFEAYELIIYFATFFLFIVGGLCIVPFVELYTKGISDANYFQPILGWTMILAEFMFCIREPYVNMAYCANRFKEVSKYAYIESAINILLSIILVIKFGIIGVAIGTLVAMTYRTICHIIYLKRNILKRNIIHTIKIFVIFCIPSFIIIILSNLFLEFNDVSVISWVIFATKNAILAMIFYVITLFIFYKKKLKEIIKIIKR